MAPRWKDVEQKSSFTKIRGACDIASRVYNME